MGKIVVLSVLLCFVSLAVLMVMFRPDAEFLVVMLMIGFFVVPVYGLLHDQIQAEKQKKEKLALDEQQRIEQLERQREADARRQWEQTTEGQEFLVQQRRDAEEQARIEKEQAERTARKTWRKWHESKTLSEIAEMSGLEFEEFLFELLERMGFSNLQLTPINDQGGDLVGDSPEGHRTVVQAKRWKNTLGNGVVQELLGAMLHYAATAGMVITNSTFTEAARQLAAKDRRITLCDGCWLETQVRKFLSTEIPEFDWATYNEKIARTKSRNHNRKTRSRLPRKVIQDVLAKVASGEVRPEDAGRMLSEEQQKLSDSN